METRDPGGADPSANAEAAQGHEISPWKGSTPPTDAPIGAGETDLWNWRKMAQAGVPGDAAQADTKKIPGRMKWQDIVLKRGAATWTPTDAPIGAGGTDLWNWRKMAQADATGSSTAPDSHTEFRGRYQLRLALAIALLAALLVGGALYVVGPWAIGVCPSGMRAPGTTARASDSVLTPCGAFAADTAGTTPVGATSAAAPSTAAPSTAPATATAPAKPSATAAPRSTATPSVKPTATATPVPRPTVSILAPANNSIATNTNGESPSSDPITFHASATPGQGASSATITWLDSVDGTLGTGATLVHTLSSQHPTNCGAPTPHVVTAKAQNNLGGVASTSITVSVVPNCLA